MASTVSTSTTQIAVEEAFMQDAAVAAMFEEEGSVLVWVQMHRRQMDEIYVLLTQHQHDIPPELLEEVEELSDGWEEELHENLPWQCLSAAENARVMEELAGCAKLLGEVKGSLVDIRKRLLDVAPEEGRGLRSSPGYWREEDTPVSDAFLVEGMVTCRKEPEEGQGTRGELDKRSFAGDEECVRLDEGATTMRVNYIKNNSNNNNNNNNNNNSQNNNGSVFLTCSINGVIGRMSLEGCESENDDENDDLFADDKTGERSHWDNGFFIIAAAG
ncbi:hypothetical protein CBR_g37752 [Chara braunii]|uniref:Uncharacterized protein n=1 Tax=Chara braunii TaxID=69332 RepID=A0A388LNU0_CHABU|nr:hypothetical protein CBR_g37752 [Chara braunii]|eukprot:GBG83883.1 hypothetical protein CBR_g37752 [Chara braunii]